MTFSIREDAPDTNDIADFLVEFIGMEANTLSEVGLYQIQHWQGIDVFCSVFGQNNRFSTIDINAGIDTGYVSATGMVLAVSNQKDLKK